MNDQEKSEFLAYCEKLTDSQLKAVYENEAGRANIVSGDIVQYHRDCRDVAKRIKMSRWILALGNEGETLEPFGLKFL